jgi:ankyrin repeat protein
VLAASIICTFRRKHVPVLYFFFRQIIDANYTPRAALQDWLAQILVHSPPLQLQLKDYLGEDNRSSSSRTSSQSRQLGSLSTGDLWQHLRTALSYLPKVYILADALDEMNSGRDADDFLQNLTDLANLRPSRVKVMITSRPVANLERALRLEKILRLKLDKGLVHADIEAYVRSRLTKSSIPIEIHGSIQTLIPARAQGLFLYAKLALDTLLEQSVGVPLTLQELPENLHLIYRHLLHEHLEKTGTSMELQVLIMQWITHSVRPLRLIEMADMLTNEALFGRKDVFVAKNCIRSACGSLLELFPDETLSVVHHTLTEFLKGMTRTNSKDYPILDSGSSHKQLALICLSYLQNGCLQALDSEEPAPRRRLAAVKNQGHVLAPFAKYAALNWHLHVKRSFAHGADQADINAMLDAFTSHAHFQKWVSIAAIRSDSTRTITPLSMAVLLGLSGYLRTLLSQAGADCDQGAPLVWAADQGFADVVELLIQHGADVSQYDGQGYTALHRAAINDHAFVVRLLLQAGCDMRTPTKLSQRGRSRSSYDQHSALWYACDHGHLETVAEFQAQMKTSKDIQTALLYAVKQKRANIVRQLLNHPLADVNQSTEGRYGFPGSKSLLRSTRGAYGFPESKKLLSFACSHRDLNTIKVLLAAGAGVNDCQLHTLVSSTEAQDSENSMQCFKSLLEAGADVHQKDSNSHLNTPLHMAADAITVSMLLEAGADIEAENRSKRTPLHTCTDVNVLNMLVNVGNANLEKTDKFGLTPLLESLNNNLRWDAKVTLALIDLGANVNAVDNQGNGTFHYIIRKHSSQETQEMIISRLCQAGGDINRANHDGEAPIHLTKIEISKALNFNNIEIPRQKSLFEVLVAAGADLASADAGSSRKPLFTWIGRSISRSNENDRPNICKVLLRCGASLHVTDDRGRTLLHDAVNRLRGKTVIPFLLEQGVDPNAADEEGNTFCHEDPTVLASSVFQNGDKLQTPLDRFMQLGIDPTRPNYHGRTPLHVLSSVVPKLVDHGSTRSTDSTGFSHHDKVNPYQFLLCLYPDVDILDKNGVTPLHIAATSSEYIVRLLLGKDASPSRVTNEGCNTLHLSARARMPNIVGMLLENLRSRSAIDLESAVNAKDHLGRTPLYYAYNAGSYEAARAFVDAGAVVETDKYENSQWEALASYETEAKNWNSYSDDGYTGAVLIADKRRPYGQLGGSGNNRIDDLITLLLAKTPSPPSLMDRTIADAASQQADYLVECLLQARSSMPMGEELVYAEQISLAVNRRHDKRMNLEKTCKNCKKQHNTSALVRANIMKRYHLFPKILLTEITSRSPPKIDATEIFGLQVLIKNGLASVLKDLIILGGPQILDDQDWSTQRPDSRRGAFGSSDQTSFEPLLLKACRRDVSNMDVIRVLIAQARHNINAQQIPGESLQPGNPNSYNKESVQSEGVLHALVRGEHWWHVNEALSYFLELVPELELRDSYGMTPLNAALHECGKPVFNKRAAELLIEHGADVNATDDAGNSCLAKACSNMEMMERLLDHGAIVTQDVFKQAIELERPDLLELFLGKGANPNVRGRKELDPNPQRLFRNLGPKEFTRVSSCEHYPLHHLLIKGGYGRMDASTYQRMLKSLLEHGADPCARYDHTTVLHELVKNSTDINDLFASGGAPFNLDLRDAYGRTPLLLAGLRNIYHDETERHNPEKRSTISLLIHHGADIRARDLQNNNILHIVASFGGRFIEPHVYAYIVQQAPELVDQCNIEKSTPLHIALKHIAFRKPATILLENRADFHSIDGDGNTMLHLVVTNTWYLGSAGGLTGDAVASMFNRLLASGLDINATNEAGETPIFAFFREGKVSLHDRRNRLPRFHEEYIYDFFTQHGADWRALNAKGQNLLHVVADKSPLGSSSFSSMSHSDTDDQSSYAYERFQALLVLGLDAGLEDKDGRTPLDVAAGQGHTKILELFL